MAIVYLKSLHFFKSRVLILIRIKEIEINENIVLFGSFYVIYVIKKCLFQFIIIINVIAIFQHYVKSYVKLLLL